MTASNFASNAASWFDVGSGTAGVVVTGTTASVSLTPSLWGQDGPLTFDLLFSLEAGLQHPEFLCECAKLLNHVGSPLRTQRLSAAAQHRLARHGWENATIRRFRLSAILMPATSHARRASLGFRLVARTQPDDGNDEEANHHDGYDEHPDQSPEQPREVGRLHA